MSSASEARRKLSALRDGFALRLPGRVAEIERGWEELRSEGWGLKGGGEVRLALHNLAGSAGTFGAPAIGEAASELASLLGLLLKEERPPKEPEWAALTEGLSRLLALTATWNLTLRPSFQGPLFDGEFNSLIDVVDDDPEFGAWLATELAQAGYEVRRFDTLEDFRVGLGERAPGAIIMDMIFATGEAAGAEAIQELKTAAKVFPPVIFVSGRDDMQARLSALRAGALRYFRKPIDLGKLKTTLDGLTLRAPATPYRVLVVDDDEDLCERHATILAGAGIKTRQLNDPLLILHALTDFEPDLVLLDVHMPGCSGLDVAAVIRQDDAFAQTVVVFLSADARLDRQLAAIGLGGDDFLTKPIEMGHLLSAVLARLKRVRYASRLQRRLEFLYRETETRLQERVRKRTAALADANERLKSILNTAVDGIVTIDSGGLIQSANAAAETMFGYTAQELIGANLEQLMPEPFRSEHDAHMAGFLETEDTKVIGTSRELAGLRRDGSVFPMRLGIGLLRLNDEFLFTGIMADNTEQTERNEALRAARAEAEAANEAKSEFLANMSHEIRTPMTGVLGMLDLIGSTELEERQRGYLEVAQSSADLLLAVINDILDFSKIEAGKLELELLDFDLRKVVENATLPLAQQAASRGVELACFVPTYIPTALRGDPVRLAQVLTNLLGNAVKFTEQGEVVVEVKAEEAGPGFVNLRFEVRDTGLGIASAAQKELFQAFTQADGSTSRRYGGTGLGLTISRRLVELMGGEIGVESVLGEGSTFWFSCSFAAGAPQLHSESDLEGRRILIVDDSATNRQIIGHYLEGWGVRVVSVASGSEALRHLLEAHDQGDPFEVALLDQKMPGLDGLALAKAIQTKPSLSGIQLVLVSSVGQGWRAFGDLGICAHLVKPVRREQLSETLGRVIGRAAAPARAHPRVLTLRGHVLLVDDMLVNQVVGQEMLQQLGLGVEVASSGREAIRRVRERRYDLVLMDCQMPDLDGFETTLQIREWEAGQPGEARELPIVAITANVLEADREQCLAAMDGYITKPFDRGALFEELVRWLPVHEHPHLALAGGGADRGSLDLQELAGLRQALGPRFETVVGHFRVESAELVAELRAAVAADDVEAIVGRAHALKGVAGNLFASALVGLCRELEAQARAGAVEAAESQIGRIAAALEQALSGLATL
ncbi:MAG: response regulator [Planctomycetes bacterium]|nr:response regulator [Planctomycetota bacterium]